MTPFAWALLIAATGMVTVIALARREHRRRRAQHSAILDPVAGAFERSQMSVDATGLPRLEGMYRGQQLRLDVIPDTMTIRRLPQLWLSITSIQALPLAQAGLAVLVRPSGADYYSLTDRMAERFDPPAEFPPECLVRGETPSAVATLAKLARVAGRIFADPKVKEIAATRRGLRIVYQLAEGKRGHYLLLRQSEFEDARLLPATLDDLVAGLAALRQSLV